MTDSFDTLGPKMDRLTEAVLDLTRETKDFRGGIKAETRARHLLSIGVGVLSAVVAVALVAGYVGFSKLHSDARNYRNGQIEFLRTAHSSCLIRNAQIHAAGPQVDCSHYLTQLEQLGATP